MRHPSHKNFWNCTQVVSETTKGQERLLKKESCAVKEWVNVCPLPSWKFPLRKRPKVCWQITAYWPTHSWICMESEGPAGTNWWSVITAACCTKWMCGNVYSYGWIIWNFFLQSCCCFTRHFSNEQPADFFLKEIINISLLDKIVTLLSSTQQEASRPPNVSATCFTHTFGHIRSHQHAQATLLISGSLLW